MLDVVHRTTGTSVILQCHLIVRNIILSSVASYRHNSRPSTYCVSFDYVYGLSLHLEAQQATALLPCSALREMQTPYLSLFFSIRSDETVVGKRMAKVC
jgi:hypothetical protein